MVLQFVTEEDRIHEDFLWLSRSIPKLQKEYLGKWVAVIDKKVISSGKDAREVYNKSKLKYPKREPLLDFVPKKELLVL